MFQKNPVKTEQGIFRRDIWGNWWELEVRSFKECFSQGTIPAVSLIHKISEAIEHLEGAVAVSDSDESALAIKGWKKVSAVHRIAEIEQSIDSGRTILELDFI